VLKVVASGFLFQTNAYLRNPWNVLDFVVVVGGYATLLPEVRISLVGWHALIEASRFLDAVCRLSVRRADAALFEAAAVHSRNAGHAHGHQHAAG
jgi:hypothetical protein